MINKLITKNLILRKANINDLDSIYNNVWKDKSIADNMLWKVINTKEEARDRIKKIINYQKDNYAYFICLKKTNEAIGFAGIVEKEPNIYSEHGICIATKYQHLGYGKEVVQALINLAFKELNGKRFIYSCFNTNEKSRKLCQSLGFKYLESKEEIRKHDNMKYIADYYYLDNNK